MSAPMNYILVSHLHLQLRIIYVLGKEYLGTNSELFKHFTTLVSSYNSARLATAAKHQAAMRPVKTHNEMHSNHTPASRPVRDPHSDPEPDYLHHPAVGQYTF